MKYKIRRFCNSKAPGLLRVTRNSVDEFRVQGYTEEGLVLDEVVDLEDAQELQDDSEDVILCTDEDGEVEITILPINGGEVIEEELEDEGYYEVSNSKTDSIDSDTARTVGKMIADYLRDEYDMSSDKNCKGSYCNVDLLESDVNMNYKSDNCIMKGNTIKISDSITIGEVSDIFKYLTKVL